MTLKIRAGCVDDIHKDSGNWLFIDIGFSSNKKSCGFLKGKGCPEPITFGDLVKQVVEETQKETDVLNMLIEAPLSVAFNEDRNPTFRKPETRKVNDKVVDHRGWWYGAGAITMLAAGYLLRKLEDCGDKRDVRLFEGFVSFKPKDDTSSDIKDVEALRDSVWDPTRRCVYGPCDLKINDSDIESAFPHIYRGIPPVVIPR